MINLSITFDKDKIQVTILDLIFFGGPNGGYSEK